MTKSLPLLFFDLCAHAQDTRLVREPSIPPACTVLQARLRSTSIDEARPDTRRIQRALDHCAAGQSVMLRAAGAGNTFSQVLSNCVPASRLSWIPIPSWRVPGMP